MKRYDLVSGTTGYTTDHEMEPADDGEWVRYDDAMAACLDLLVACKEFVRKCEVGEARSIRSYAQMTAAIAKAEGQ